MTFRRNNSLSRNGVLNKQEVNDGIVRAEAEQLSQTREKIIAVLKLMLNGDSLAAELLLLNLISRVHTRKDAFTLGNMTVNITNLSFIQSRHLANFIKSITPFSMLLPLSLETLEQK